MATRTPCGKDSKVKVNGIGPVSECIPRRARKQVREWTAPFARDDGCPSPKRQSKRFPADRPSCGEDPPPLVTDAPPFPSCFLAEPLSRGESPGAALRREFPDGLRRGT